MQDARTGLKIAPGRGLLAAACVAATLLLASCGGSDEPKPQAATSDIATRTLVAGPTPFIIMVPLAGQDLKKVLSYRYIIAAKAGAIARPVDITYSAAALARLGHTTTGSATVSLPVFGLYAGHLNNVKLDLAFADGSHQELALAIPTTAYVEPKGVYDRPVLLQKRTVAGADLNYMYIKSQMSGPIVIDADGEIRWVAPALVNAFSSAFDNYGFVIGGQNSVDLTRIELDGRTTTGTLAATNYTRFHHNIDHGKSGLLGEVDGLINGQASLESALIEFSASGAVLKEWDFADLMGRYMRQQGDDPSPFIRAGIDWFHINAATYDPRDDSIIASSRENFVAKFDYSTGNLKWILGDPTKYWYTFASLRAKALTLEAGGLYPIGQHATSITASGLLMMFNDGFASANQPVGTSPGASRAYSAVSAYEIDPVAMTAREKWSFDYGKTILSQICSSAYEAKGGSILVSYAVASNRTKARLVGLDPSRNVLFDFEYATSGCATSWNAEPMPFEAMSIL
jgi:arylsulfate sulfotransferase